MSYQLTTAAELKARAAEKLFTVITLPELGVQVRVRRLQYSTFIKTGHVPDSFINGFTQRENGEGSAKITNEQFAEIMEFRDQVVLDCVVSLKIVRENPGEDEVALSDFPDADKEAILTAAQGGSIELKGGETVSQDDLANFRQEHGVPSGGDSGGQVEGEAEPPNADSGEQSGGA